MPALTSAQHGTKTITSADGTTITQAITSVNLSRSIVFYTSRDGDSAGRDLRHIFQVALTSSTQISFTRNDPASSTITIEWWVLEFDPSDVVSVQAGVQDCTSDPQDITISAVAPENCVPLHFVSTSSLSLQARAAASFPASTTFRLDFPTAQATGTYVASWQALEFTPDAVDIQSGTITLVPGVGSATATIVSVNTAKTAMVHGGIVGASSTSPQSRVASRLTLTNATTVTAERGTQGTNPNLIVQYYAVEFNDKTNVEQGGLTIPAGSTSVTSSAWSPAFAPAKTSVMNAFWGQNQFIASDQTPNSVHFTVVPNATVDAVTVTRNGSLGDLNTGWTAIEWNGPAQFYVNTASAGGDGTTNGTSGANAAFASLLAAQTGIVDKTVNTTIDCSGGIDSAGPVSLSGWTVGRLTVRGNRASGNGFNPGPALIDTNYYLFAAGNVSGQIGMASSNTTLDGLQIEAGHATGFGAAIKTSQSLIGLVIKKCRLRNTNSTDNGIGSGGSAINIALDAYDNIIAGFAGGIDVRLSSFSSQPRNYYNNTIYGDGTGNSIAVSAPTNASATINIKGNALGNNAANSDIVDSTTGGVTVNYATNGSVNNNPAFGEFDLVSPASAWTAPGTGRTADFTVKDASSALYQSIPTTYVPDDVIDAVRTSPTESGAFKFTGTGPIVYQVAVDYGAVLGATVATGSALSGDVAEGLVLAQTATGPLSLVAATAQGLVAAALTSGALAMLPAIAVGPLLDFVPAGGFTLTADATFAAALGLATTGGFALNSDVSLSLDLATAAGLDLIIGVGVAAGLSLVDAYATVAELVAAVQADAALSAATVPGVALSGEVQERASLAISAGSLALLQATAAAAVALQLQTAGIISGSYTGPVAVTLSSRSLTGTSISSRAIINVNLTKLP